MCQQQGQTLKQALQQDVHPLARHSRGLGSNSRGFSCRTHKAASLCCRLLPPLQNQTGFEEVVRFNGVFKGFTFRVRRKKFQLPLLKYLLALPHIKHIEPDQLFYPEAATGEQPLQQPACSAQQQQSLVYCAVSAWLPQPGCSSSSKELHSVDTQRLQSRSSMLRRHREARRCDAPACGVPAHACVACLLAIANSIGGKYEVPTGIFRMKSALYNNRSAELAWVQPNVTKHDVVVAVLDTGIDAGHPDLAGNVVGGLSFVGEDPLEDLNGHGTHVAGTISANNNGFGTSGVYPGSKVFALQVFNKLGTGSTSSIVGAINWLAQNGRSKGIRVANMSLGGPSSVAVCSAVYQAVSKGITFVVAAGGRGGSLAAGRVERAAAARRTSVCRSSIC